MPVRKILINQEDKGERERKGRTVCLLTFFFNRSKKKAVQSTKTYILKAENSNGIHKNTRALTFYIISAGSATIVKKTQAQKDLERERERGLRNV